MATVSGKTSDITLDGLKQWVGNEATQAYERQIKTLEDSNKQLGAFQSKIEARVKELQDSRIPIPAQETLLKEANQFVETYDRLYIEALKAQKLGGELSRVIEFLTPRIIVTEAEMKKRGGDLAEVTQLTDEACMRSIQSLKDCQGIVDTLQRKMLEEISLKTTHTVQNLRNEIIAQQAKSSSASNAWSAITSWFSSGEEKPARPTQVGDNLDDFRTETSLLNSQNQSAPSQSDQFVDITLSSLKEQVFLDATQTYEKQIENIEKANADLGSFERDVDAIASPLQKGLITIPPQESLLAKRAEFVSEYDRLYIAAFKAKMLAGELQRVIDFLSPRAIVDEATMNAHGGQLAKVSQRTDETYRTYILTLIGQQAKVDTLQKRMVSQILDTTAWSVQRFCQIVDNEGNPLNLLTRMINRRTWAVVPEYSKVQAFAEEVGVKLGKSTPSLPALDSEERGSPLVTHTLPESGSDTVSENQSQGDGNLPAAVDQRFFDSYDTESPELPEDLVQQQGVEPIPSVLQSQIIATPSFSDSYDTASAEAVVVNKEGHA